LLLRQIFIVPGVNLTRQIKNRETNNMFEVEGISL